MKTKFCNISLISVIALYFVANLYLFLLTDNFVTIPFWIAWGFTFGVNMIVALVIYFRTKKLETNDYSGPLIMFVIFILANLVYGYLDFFFMLIGSDNNEEFTIRLTAVIYLTVTVVYVIALAFGSFVGETAAKKKIK